MVQYNKIENTGDFILKRKIMVMVNRVDKVFALLSVRLRKKNIVRFKIVKPEDSITVLSRLWTRKYIHTLYVGEDKEFKKINDAVKNANDTPDYPVTIRVSPKVYPESVKIKGGRYLSIIGDDKETCILREDSGNYWTPPLELGGNSNIENMSIVATHESGGEHILPSFAIHQDFAGEGKSVIKNCKLISYQHSAIGLGLHNNQTVIIDSCDIYSTAGAALFAHNRKKNDAKNQKLIIKNSVLESAEGSPILIHDANHRTNGGRGDARDTEFGFYNNVFKSGDLKEDELFIDGDKPLEEGRLAGYIKLMDDSHGNNISALNAHSMQTAK